MKPYNLITCLLLATAWAAPITAKTVPAPAVVEDAALTVVPTNRVTQAEALSVARQFMSKRGIDIPATAKSRATGHSGTNSASNPLYVFNADRGYVIVSGDNRTAPVLGYADEGTFDEQDMPDGLRWMLQTYQEQIGLLDSLFAASSAQLSVATPSTPPNSGGAPIPYPTPARHSIDPLLPMNWNQGEPYNLLCPRYYNQDGSEGGLSATGCVATAMAQAIGYYRWPERTKRAIPGYLQKYSTDQGEKSVRLTNIPSGSVIDWDNILNNYNGSETEEQKKAIAELMLWVGMDCKMNFGASSSSGFSEGIDGLVNYFDYDDGTHVAKRDLYTMKQWHDLIYNEIATGHPVPFGGQNSGGGHAFVLDGYDADGLFHVNWGWGGMSNGYYRIDVLDPGNNSGIGASLTPGGYNMGQDAIVGMRRPDDIKADEEDTPQSRIKLSANDWEIRGTNRFFANYVNWSGVSATWDMGIGYVNGDGKLEAIGNYATAQIGQNFFSSQEFTVPKSLAAGIYHIVPISKRSTDKSWRTNMSPELRYVYTEVDASGNVTKMEIRPIVNVALTELAFPGNHKRGDDQTVRATLRNDGEEELFAEIHLLASQSQDKGGSKCRTLLNLPMGSENTVALSFKPEQTGTWNIWLATDWNGDNVVGEATIEITDEGVDRGHRLRYMSHTIGNRSNGNVYGNCFQGRVTIQNTSSSDTYDGTVRLWLFKQGDNGMFYDAGSVYVPLQIEPRRTANADYYFGNLELGANYAMSILYGEGGDIQDGGLRAMGRPQAGVVYWQSNQAISGLQPQATVNTPSGAVAIDLRAVTNIVKTVKPNSNPNTLYLMGTTAAEDDGLSGCNVVRGDRAEKITISSDNAFFTPVAFTAAEAMFTVSPAATTAPQWQTVVLPFKPDQTPDGVQMATFTETSWQGEPTISILNADLSANLPYLMLADNNEPKTFSATDARFSPTAEAQIVIYADDYFFEGTTTGLRQQQVYVLNNEGTAFEYVEGQKQMKPFTAWFKAPEGAPAISLSENLVSLGIGTVHGLQTTDHSAVFDLQGRRVGEQGTGQGANLSKGIYIANGKKVVIR